MYNFKELTQRSDFVCMCVCVGYRMLPSFSFDSTMVKDKG